MGEHGIGSMGVHEDGMGSMGDEGHESMGIKLVEWKWHEVGVYFAPVLFLVLSGLAKLLFHHIHWLSSRVPESCLLILIGLLYGLFINQVGGTREIFPQFSPNLFFYFLLPPIILEAAYSLYCRVFLDNLKTILLFAILGTILNFLMVGGLLVLVQHLGAMGPMPLHSGSPCQNCSLNGTEEMRIDLGTADIFLFSSLISAVDPVAVLAIFSEIGVNADLYFLVFGESLLNDGVAVVLYNMMKSFATMEEIPTLQYFLAICSFFTVALGGLLVGMVYGFLTALITRITKEVQVMEPLAMFGMAYLAYASADMLNWSGIISIIGCGLVQAHYSFKNISDNSQTTVKYFISMMSSTSDCMIFLYLGMAIADNQVWHTGFTCWTLLFCLAVRFAVVFIQIFIVNKFRVKPIEAHEQFIIAYGGLRGAVGFSLVSLIDKKMIEPANMFVTTTLVVVMFTAFVQGATIKKLVKLLKIDLDKTKDVQKSINEEMNGHLMEHIMSGIEIISGRGGGYYFRTLLGHYDEKYLMKWFCRPDYHHEISKVFDEVALSDHLINLYGPTVLDEGVSKYENYGFEQNEDDKIATNVKPVLDRKVSTEVREFFSKALQENPFNNLHKRANKNMINGDEQELKTHLMRRRDKTRRMSVMAIVSGTNQMYNHNKTIMERKTLGETSTHTGEDDTIDLAGDEIDEKSQTIARKLRQVPVSQRAGVEAVLQMHTAKRSAKILQISSAKRSAKIWREATKKGKREKNIKQEKNQSNNYKTNIQETFYEMNELDRTKL